ncbi:unnamed protein product [Rhizophagus irregularis]|nr:unnamed protein product [Rhizophagus irregularis]
MTLKTNIYLLRTVNEPDAIEGQISTIDALANNIIQLPNDIKNVIEAEIITGKHAGKYAFLPHITLSSTNATLPFIFKYCQFLIQPAFVMTINKSQGQTLNWVGLYFPTPVFAHRQFYVACSKVTTKKNLKIITTKDHDNRNLINCTYNIVYLEVFQ